MFHVPKEYRKKASFYQYIILFIALVVVLVFYIDKIGSFFAWILSILFPFILGLGLAFVFNVFSNNFMAIIRKVWPNKKETKRLRFFCNCLSIILFILIIIAFFLTIIPQLLSSIDRLVINLPYLAYHLKQIALDLTASSKDLHRIVENIDLNSINTNVLFSYLEESSKIIFGNNTMIGQVNSIITTTISWITTFFLSFVFSIFVIFNKEKFVQDLHDFFYSFLPSEAYKNMSHIYHVFCHTFAKYIGGTLIECCILATLVTVVSSILHLPYSLLCGFVIGIGALIPMFGAICAAFLCTLLILIQSPAQGVTFFIMFICIQQIEGNFIYPNVVGKSVGLPSMYVIVAITVGASIGGVLGMVVFIPFFSSIYRLLREYEKKRMAKKGLIDINDVD